MQVAKKSAQSRQFSCPCLWAVGVFLRIFQKMEDIPLRHCGDLPGGDFGQVDLVRRRISGAKPPLDSHKAKKAAEINVITIDGAGRTLFDKIQIMQVLDHIIGNVQIRCMAFRVNGADVSAHGKTPGERQRQNTTEIMYRKTQISDKCIKAVRPNPQKQPCSRLDGAWMGRCRLFGGKQLISTPLNFAKFAFSEIASIGFLPLAPRIRIFILWMRAGRVLSRRLPRCTFRFGKRSGFKPAWPGGVLQFASCLQMVQRLMEVAILR